MILGFDRPATALVAGIASIRVASQVVAVRAQQAG